MCPRRLPTQADGGNASTRADPRSPDGGKALSNPAAHVLPNGSIVLAYSRAPPDGGTGIRTDLGVSTLMIVYSRAFPRKKPSAVRCPHARSNTYAYPCTGGGGGRVEQWLIDLIQYRIPWNAALIKKLISYRQGYSNAAVLGFLQGLNFPWASIHP